ncbi:glycosyl transferase [Alsobacter metallidurans]|uniref:Glycosyl transferase n=1 Tax=Alsobacter metallidurans TaxID=340221 RepID=A0A917I4Z7_9HYPH|nr:glycosyltransferase family A protein [Alsobacter metallidurans]GGH13263.1 glycosyl transferase [Alsobacter metallidurans]
MHFKIFVIVATKGRAAETRVLFDRLSQQSRRPDGVVVVGSEDCDIAGLSEHATGLSLESKILLAPQPGASVQRNIGLEEAAQWANVSDSTSWLAVFFDDDFRPHEDWLLNCAKAFEQAPDLIGLTGLVIADGVNGDGFSEIDATEFLSGGRAPSPHWTARGGDREIDCLYGCNMAFRGSVARELRFDERLPLYSWQEDRDYSKRASRHGRLEVLTACRGVHLGINSGRTSGLRFGYSQISNIAYLVTKRSISIRGALRFSGRNMVANLARTLLLDRRRDYPGRLRGNLLALGDLFCGRIEPERVLRLGEKGNMNR